MYTAHCTVLLNTFFSLNATVCPSVPCSELCSVFLSFTSRGRLYTCYYLCSFQAFFRLSWIFIHAPPYSCFDNLCFTLLLKRSYIVYFQCLFVLFTFVVNCLWCSHSSDLFALLLCQWKYCFSRTRPLTTVQLSLLHLVLHLHPRHSCLFVFIYSLLTPSLLSLPTTTHPHSPAWLRSCSFIPRGEEQTPIITQVSVKWIIGRLIELLDGKHPSWVVRLSVLSLLPHLSADALDWCIHIHCHCWERQGVVCSRCML